MSRHRGSLGQQRCTLPPCYGLAAAGNKRAVRPPLPLPGCGGEWGEPGRNGWVGEGRSDSSEQREQEQQRHRSGEERRQRQSPQRSCRRLALPSHLSLPTALLPPIRTRHGGTWYGTPCSDWPGWVRPPSCAPCWLPVRINPVLAEPGTHPQISICPFWSSNVFLPRRNPIHVGQEEMDLTLV